MMMPMVTVITPTFDRLEMFRRCVINFINQDYLYRNKQMIVVNSGIMQEYINHNTVPEMYIYKHGEYYVRDEFIHIGVGNTTIGEQRNIGIKKAQGGIIIHMDDDDIYTPQWITNSVQALISSKNQLVGLSTAYFLNTSTREVHDLQPDPNNQLYICGATMCYYKSFWERKPFENISAGEDFNFQFNNGSTACHGYKEGFLATVHGGNTVSHYSLPLIKKVAPQDAELLIHDFENKCGIRL